MGADRSWIESFKGCGRMTIDDIINKYEEKARKKKESVIRSIGLAMDYSEQAGTFGEIRIEESEIEELKEAFEYEQIAKWLKELKDATGVKK